MFILVIVVYLKKHITVTLVGKKQHCIEAPWSRKICFTHCQYFTNFKRHRTRGSKKKPNDALKSRVAANIRKQEMRLDEWFFPLARERETDGRRNWKCSFWFSRCFQAMISRQEQLLLHDTHELLAMKTAVKGSITTGVELTLSVLMPDCVQLSAGSSLSPHFSSPPHYLFFCLILIFVLFVGLLMPAVLSSAIHPLTPPGSPSHRLVCSDKPAPCPEANGKSQSALVKLGENWNLG